MSTNKTQNYNLHSWVPEDDFIRSEFNDNFTGIDAALKSLSDDLADEATARASAVATEKTAREQAVAAEKTAREQAIAAEKTAREQAVTAEQNARKQAITAEQNARKQAINTLTSSKTELVVGSYTGDGVVPRTINLGFQPKAVLLVQSSGEVYNYNSSHGGLFFPGHPITDRYGSTTFVEIIGSSFRINQQDPFICFNDNGRPYYYLAFK